MNYNGNPKFLLVTNLDDIGNEAASISKFTDYV